MEQARSCGAIPDDACRVAGVPVRSATMSNSSDGPENPPPLVLPPVIPSPRPGRGWMVVATVLFLLLAVSMLSNLTHFAKGVGHVGAMGKGSRLGDRFYEESVIEDNVSKDKLVVIPVTGIITSHGFDGDGLDATQSIKDQLELAAEDQAVKGVILKVDSPGGEVLASDEIYRAIVDFQERTDKPVVAVMGSLAASGGYYVSAPCRWIVANELTITGSIGVIMHGYNIRGLMNKVGVQPMVFKSGKFKDMLSSDKLPEEITVEEKKMVQAMIDETYGRFQTVVEDGRRAANKANAGKGKDAGRPLQAGWKDLADGRILSGKQAHEAGLVDELGNMEVAVARAQKLAGISRANLVRYTMPVDFSRIFRLFGQTQGRGVKIDLGVEVPKLLPGRMYFLLPSAL